MENNLWDMVNANAFYKVNSFGKDIHFYFHRDLDAEYITDVGNIVVQDDTVILMVKVV